MPTVPSRNSFSVLPTQNSGVRVQNASVEGAGAVVGRQIQERGAAVQNLGKAQGEIALDIQNEANRLRVDDAINQAKEIATRNRFDPEQGYERFKGYDALNRPNGQPIAEEFGEGLSKQFSEIEDALGNDQQKSVFNSLGKDIVSGFKNTAIQYEGAQFRNYSISVREGTIKNRIQNIALNYKDPGIIAEDIHSIQSAAHDLGRQLGKSAEWSEAKSREATSSAHMVVIETALDEDEVEYADDYFKKYAKQMDANHIFSARAKLSGELDKKVAVDVAQNIIKDNFDKIVTPDSDRAFNIAVGTESGGRQFNSEGKPLTSSKGAIGVAQVMPATAKEAAKFAGLKWDEEKYKNDPEYNKAIGKAYFERQLKDFEGNLPKAYAAYNAGPGATLKAVKKAKSEGEPANWLEHLPLETKNYVAKNMKEFNSGLGTNQKPSLRELKAQVREKIGDEDTRRLQMAYSSLEGQYKAIEAEVKFEGEQNVAEAMKQVLANGGNYTALPAGIRSSIPPKEISKVMDFAKRISTGDDSTNLWLYNQLTANPEALAGMSDDQFYALRSELSISDYKLFSKQRASILSGELPENKNPGSLNSSAINSTLNDRLKMIGLDPNPKGKGDDVVQIGSIRKFVNEQILSAQRSSGRHMDDGEVMIFIDKLFSTQSEFDRFWVGSGPMLSMEANDIPDNTYDAIVLSMKKQGINNPGDGDILNIYWNYLTRKGQKGTTKGVF